MPLTLRVLITLYLNRELEDHHINQEITTLVVVEATLKEVVVVVIEVAIRATSIKAKMQPSKLLSARTLSKVTASMVTSVLSHMASTNSRKPANQLHLNLTYNHPQCQVSQVSHQLAECLQQEVYQCMEVVCNPNIKFLK